MCVLRPEEDDPSPFIMDEQMNHKERILAALEGKSTDFIPWVPRLDLWYRANSLAGTLPSKYGDASLTDILDDTGMGLHAVVPNFRDLRNPDDDIDRALGIYNLWTMPYRTVLENVERNVRIDGDRTYVEYKTPVGTVSTVVLYDEAMLRAGISITHVEQHSFKTPDDYTPLGYIFENARVEPNYGGYSEFAHNTGDRGIAVGFISLAASPMHLIQRELMPLDTFFYEIYDHPDQVKRLSDKISSYWDRVLAISAESPADVLFLGANYDASVTYPPFFAEHILPTLKKFAVTLHDRSKYLLTHTDGENTGLLQHYLDSNIDIADSICPAPMTKLPLKEVRDFFGKDIVIMGGIPSVALLQMSMNDQEFDTFLDGFFEEIGDGSNLILGISDTTPPQADFDRLLKIIERVRAFGPVPASR